MADPPGIIRACKCGCGLVVPTSLNKGVRKLFYNPQHAHRYHSRLYNRRHVSKTGQYARTDDSGNIIQFERNRPLSAIAAENYYKAHIERGNKAATMCPLATQETDYTCPAQYHEDFWSKDKKCLIYATLVDDMREQRALEGLTYAYERQWTTGDGRWKPDSPESDPWSVEEEAIS